MLVIGVVNLKGGTSKTTTTAFLLHAMSEANLSVIGVDADPQGSLGRWAEQADWSIPVVGMPVANLHKQLPGVVGDGQVGTQYDAVVVDTPPLEDHRSIVMSVLRMATHVLTPMAPTPIEYERLSAVSAAVVEAADLRRDERAPMHSVVLTRTVPNAASTGVYRDAVVEDGVKVHSTDIRNLQRYAQAYGDAITGALDTGYADVLNDLFDMEGATV